MRFKNRLRLAFRTHIHADRSFAPDAAVRAGDDLRMAAGRLDDGSYPVFCSSMLNHAPLGVANYLGPRLAARRVLFLVWFTWAMRKERQILRALTAHRLYRRRYPEHRFVFMCNELEEVALFRENGLNAVFCSHNALADEETFKPVPGAERVYDAFYNALISPWKRRHLARLVPSAAHVFYESRLTGRRQTAELLKELKRMMPAHHFLNPHDDTRIEKLHWGTINTAIAASATGLCLSAEEGAMYASIEYLLAGLPVVSTPSIGGRHLFGTPETWLTVEPTEEAVRDGVAEMKARNVPPERVRAITLDKVHEHRKRLRACVLVETDGQVDLPEDYGHAVYRGLNNWQRGLDFARLLVDDYRRK
jgi:glycosyltransferase involved in cell wall biosynthesis